MDPPFLNNFINYSNFRYLEDIECPLDCGLDGLCEVSPPTISGYRCRCSYGQTGTNCEKGNLQ